MVSIFRDLIHLITRSAMGNTVICTRIVDDHLLHITHVNFSHRILTILSSEGSLKWPS